MDSSNGEKDLKNFTNQVNFALGLKGHHYTTRQGGDWLEGTWSLRLRESPNSFMDTQEHAACFGRESSPGASEECGKHWPPPISPSLPNFPLLAGKEGLGWVASRK